MSNDPTVELVTTIARAIEEPWQGYALNLEFGDGYRSTSGYLYAPDGSTTPFSLDWDDIEKVLYDYLGQYLKAGDRLPAALLVQFDQAKGGYEVTWEEENVDRWHASPANIATLPEEMRPSFD